MMATAPEPPRVQSARLHPVAHPVLDERFRAWRATLEALPGFGADGPRVLLLTSPDTSVRCAGMGLARAFAHAGQRTLLIDGSDRDVSESDATNGSRQVAEELAAWLAKRTNTLPAPRFSLPLPMLLRLPLCMDGTATNDPIAPDKLQRLLAWAKQEMDRVVVIARPLSESADGLLLARWTDCAVLGVRPGHTTRGLAIQAREDLTRSGGTVVGSICLD